MRAGSGYHATTNEPHGPLASPGFWLHHAALTRRRAVESRLGEITYPQFNVLSAVNWLTAPGRYRGDAAGGC